MPIRACPDCGSDRLLFPKGETTFSCQDCPWHGTPNEYANWTAWQQARQAAKPPVVAP